MYAEDRQKLTEAAVILRALESEIGRRLAVEYADLTREEHAWLRRLAREATLAADSIGYVLDDMREEC